jgi:hypothetical protein
MSPPGLSFVTAVTNGSGNRGLYHCVTPLLDATLKAAAGVSPRLVASQEVVMQTVRWPSRVLGFLLVFLVLLVALGQGLTEDVQLLLRPGPIDLVLLGCLLLMLVGVVVGWHRVIAGATLAIAGFLGFWLINLFTRSGAVSQVLPLFPLLGLLYVIVWWRARSAGSIS